MTLSIDPLKALDHNSLGLILSHLDLLQLANLSQVNKEWKQRIDNLEIWDRLFTKVAHKAGETPIKADHQKKAFVAHHVMRNNDEVIQRLQGLCNRIALNERAFFNVKSLEDDNGQLTVIISGANQFSRKTDYEEKYYLSGGFGQGELLSNTVTGQNFSSGRETTYTELSRKKTVISSLGGNISIEISHLPVQNSEIERKVLEIVHRKLGKWNFQKDIQNLYPYVSGIIALSAAYFLYKNH